MRSGKQKIKRIKKLNKICGFVCAVLIAICFAFSTANFAYASNVDWDEVNGGMTIDNIGFSVNQGAPESITVGGSSRFKTDVSVTLNWRQYYLFDYYYTYFGYLDLAYNIWLQVGYNVTGNNFFEYRIKDIITENPNTKVTASNPWVSTEGGKNYINLGSIRVTEFLNENLYETGQNNCSVTIIYEFVYSTNNALNTFQKYWDLCQVMYNKLYYTKNGSLTLNDIASIDTSIYNQLIDVYGYLINDQTAYLEDIISAIQSAGAGLVVSDPNIIEDTDDKASEIADINDNVDSAIASAAPDSAQEISAVGQMIQGHGTFWSAQQNAVTFWKDAINYAFDFSVVSYLATGLSIVLIIILFIFVLRL